MRKNAGFFIMTMLLLVAPALANAWTFTVQVVGGGAGNNVVLTGGVSKTLTSGTNYYYPSAPVTTTVKLVNGATATMTVNGVAVNPVANDTARTLSSGSNKIVVTFSANAASSGVTLANPVGANATITA